MRICHVSPHLPPDQAANALLPAELGALGARARRRRHVRHARAGAGPTRARRRWPGRCRACRARRAPSALARLLRLDTLRQARAHHRGARRRRAATPTCCTCTATGSSSKSRRRGRDGAACRTCSRCTARRSGTTSARWPIDPFTRAYRGARDVTFYSQRLLDRARRTRPRSRPGSSVVYPAVSAAFTPRDAATRARVARGARHHRAARRPQRQAAARAGRPDGS